VTDRLYRSRDDRMIAGVAGGVAEMLDADPSIIRIVWALLAFVTGGIGLLVYIVMWIVVPKRPEGMPVAPPPAAAGTPGASEPVPQGGWQAPDGSTAQLAATPSTTGPTRRDPADRARGGLILGLVLIVVGGAFLIRQLIPTLDLSLWWPIAAIGLGILLVILALLPSRRSG